MIRLTTSTKLMAMGVALSLGWIVLSACECDETKEQNFPGFWVSCVGNKPTLMTYNGDNAVTVSSEQAGNFSPSEWDCSNPNSPNYKGSQKTAPFKTSGPGGPAPGARPRAASNITYSYIPKQLLWLPFTPIVQPPANPACNSNFPDVFKTNHLYANVVRISTCPVALKTVIPVFQYPLQVDVTPDGSTAVVTSFGPQDGEGGAVTFIDLATNKVTNTLMMPPGVTPNGLAISPDGNTAYVGNFQQFGQSVVVINIPMHTITTTITNVVPYPSAMTLTPDGSQLWVGSPLGSETDVIDTATLTTVFRMNIQQSGDISFNSTGTMAYVTSALNAPGQVFAVDTATYRTLSTYTVGNNPVDISMSYGDQFLVVNNTDDTTVSIIDLKRDKVVTSAVGANPKGIAFVQ
ncbi:MAG TPA: hypothetical protein VFW44_08390 [Bryobacteraceae bacterium]|nr:hypothetical protein [Bryobacteraceae bacterium]